MTNKNNNNNNTTNNIFIHYTLFTFVYKDLFEF